MILPSLLPSEAEAVRASGRLRRVDYPGGSSVAMSGHSRIFASGGAVSFEALWAQAEAIKAEVADARD